MAGEYVDRPKNQSRIGPYSRNYDDVVLVLKDNKLRYF